MLCRQGMCQYLSLISPLPGSCIICILISCHLTYRKSRDVDESRPVQRSSSWKVGQAERSHKRHNRNSDRRKTCLPVLQFSSFVDNSDSAYDSQRRRCSAGEERKTTKEPATENSCEVKVYQIGSEQVEMQKDKVKRRTKGQ